MRKLELVGRTFDRLTVIQRARIVANTTFWICQCSCDGMYTIIQGKGLISKKIRSCGCLRRETSQKIARIRIAANTLPSGVASFNLLFAIYKFQANKRKFPFELTKDEFRILTKKKCFYCGAEPAQIHKNRFCKGDYIYNGVDRKVNTLGYTIENSVPCCGTCNVMKMEMSVDEFISACQSVIAHQSRIGEQV